MLASSAVQLEASRRRREAQAPRRTACVGSRAALIGALAVLAVMGFAAAGEAAQRGAAAASAPADPNVEFIAALREAGWGDTAVAYVQWVEKSPLMTEAFREQLPLEQALSQAAGGRAARTREERTRLLTQAAESFQAFAKSDPESAAALDALRRAANLYAELALGAIADAEQAGDSAARSGATSSTRRNAWRWRCGTSARSGWQSCRSRR